MRRLFIILISISICIFFLNSCGDDNGLVLPPNLAPYQVVIVPIYKSEEELSAISVKVAEISKALRSLGISVKYDDRTTQKPGWKFAEYELKGVPVRLAMGPRDLENGTIEIARRDTLEKQNVSQDGIEKFVEKLLAEIQNNLFDKAKKFRDEHITEVNSFEEFKNVLEHKTGFISAHWDGTSETEQKIKELQHQIQIAQQHVQIAQQHAAKAESNFNLLIGISITIAILVLIIGVAMGSKARKDANKQSIMNEGKSDD